MRISGLSLASLATLTSFLVTASPLPSMCRCAAPQATSLLPHLPSQQRLSSSSFCDTFCQHVSKHLAPNYRITQVHVVELEDDDALPAPIDPTERPIPTSVLMQLSSQSENKPSEPPRTATPGVCLESCSTDEDRLGESFSRDRVQAQIDSFEQRYLVLILIGLLALFLVAVAIVESVEQLWKRSSSLYPGRGRIMLVDDSERLLAHYPDSDDELDEKMEI